MGDEASSTSSYYKGKMKAMLKNAKPYVLIVGLQMGYAVMYIIGMNALNHGLSRFALVVYRNAFAALAFAPLALLLERLHLHVCT